MQLLPPLPPEPPLVRRWLASLRHALIGFFCAPIASFALGYATMGVGSTAANVLGFVSASGFIARVFALTHRRQTIIHRLRQIDWAACTACASPLEKGATRCPECGHRVTAAEAASLWKASRWAR